MPSMLVFEVWGRYAHFKKIYATTTAVSYMIPPKTSIYGLLSAIIGLDKNNNAYLQHFTPGACQIALQLRRPVVMQRINTNLRPKLGRMNTDDNRSPTMVEYVYQPYYRLFCTHNDPQLYQTLRLHLQEHRAIYTPTLGLASLIANFAFIGEFDYQTVVNPAQPELIHSIIPMSKFVDFSDNFSLQNEVVEISQYALEMNTQRIVTLRDDVLIDRKAQPIAALVSEYAQVLLPDEAVKVIMI